MRLSGRSCLVRILFVVNRYCLLPLFVAQIWVVNVNVFRVVFVISDKGPFALDDKQK